MNKNPRSMTRFQKSIPWRLTPLFCLIILFFISVHGAAAKKKQTLETRFASPTGFHRIILPPHSFGAFLRTLTLKKPGSAVFDYRGRVFKKENDSTVAAVTDMDIRGKKLEQCMDILMRLYGSFLIGEKQSDKIIFPLPDGLALSWPVWAKGMRPAFKGLHFYLEQRAATDTSRRNFERYLNTMFSYTGSQTFYHYYPRIPLENMQPGDFITRKQRRGHAVLIMDMAVNERGEKRIIVGQGDTPACPLYILKNRDGSPWFTVHPHSRYPNLPIKKKMYWQGLRRFPSALRFKAQP